MGVTGARASVDAAAETLVAAGPRRWPRTSPVCVGLGVSTGAQAAEVAAFADGVIVGSALCGACWTRRTRPAWPRSGRSPQDLAAGVRRR